MNLFIAFAITGVVTSVAVTAVLAAGFSILLGFIVFLALTSYDDSRSGAEAEALGIAQQIETAQLLGSDVAPRLSGPLLCYARYVAGPETPAIVA